MMGFLQNFFTYETTKSVVVKSWTIGIINRIIQLLILTYFIGWVFIHEKAYQVYESSIDSSVMTKVKGVGQYSNHVLDVADYVTPPQGGSIFFIITKFIPTENQHQGSCPEVNTFPAFKPLRCIFFFFVWALSLSRVGPPNPTHHRLVFFSALPWLRGPAWVTAWGGELHPTSGDMIFPHFSLSEIRPPLFSEHKQWCNVDEDCGKKTSHYGILTGKCRKFNATFRTCEIQGWCPAEIDTVKPVPMWEAENFTIFIKNSIRFPRFNFEKGNLHPNLNETYIKSCTFHPISEQYCPIFRLGDVVHWARQDFTELAEWGGVLSIKISWICDLDRSEDQCNPDYTFSRLDTISEKNNVSKGYNFRYAKYYKYDNGTEYRTLLKAFGIRVDVMVNGKAGKFNMIPTLINLVATFTSVGVGTVLCDIILLNFLKGADQYKAKKFEEVTEFHIMRSITLNQSVQTLAGKSEEKRSTDSGTFSIGH
ncbi:P2X purinoceptor 3 [Latimeria chalumnae]|uniref:P2X purinoceptor 3 n=1 Tax=Latimeria chalumnae TaxID=7897 RepID=UPI00313F1576